MIITIVEDIKQKINSGQLKPSDAVPSENALCKEYGASRMTVRKGLAILANDGCIHSIPGKGSFVRKPELNKYTIYYNEMNNSINTVDQSRLLEVNIIMPDEKLAGELQTTINKNVIVIRRLFYTEGEPVAYDIKYLLYSKGMPIVEKEIEQATFPEMVSGSMSAFSLKKELSISAQIISGSPFVIQNIFGASPQVFSLIFAMNGLGIIFAGQITGRLAPKIEGVKLYEGGLTLTALSGFVLLLAILFKASLPVVLIPLFFVVSCVGVVGTAGSALAMENYGHAAGSASALLGLLSFS